jgi:hypothetical protein
MIATAEVKQLRKLKVLFKVIYCTVHILYTTIIITNNTITKVYVYKTLKCVCHRSYNHIIIINKI